MAVTYSYSKLTYSQWILGLIVLFFFLGLAIANSDVKDGYFGVLFFLFLLIYGIYLYRKFLLDPSEIAVDGNQLVLKFRKAPEKVLKSDEIEYIMWSNNPFFDYIKGKLEIKLRNSDDKFRISGNIRNFEGLIKSLNDLGFEIKNYRH